MKNRNFLWVVFFFFISTGKISAIIRVTRQANSSKFIHHNFDYEVTTPELLPEEECRSDSSDDIIEIEERRKRSSGEEQTNDDEKPQVDISHLSPHFISCGHSFVEQGCYDILPNGSVHVPLYQRTFNSSDFIIDSKQGLYICPEFFDEKTDDTKFSFSLAVVTLVGTAISAFCICLHVSMFLAIKKLRNLPGYSLFSLCMALLLAYTCTYVPYAWKEVSDCTAVGIIKAYAFLASFFWMNTMSYDIWRSLRMATSQLRLTADRPMLTRFAMYSAYAWGTPLMIIIVGLIVTGSSGSDFKYHVTMATDTCWFKYRQALVVYFAAPLFTLLFANVFLFLSSFCMINNATMNTAENRADLWSRFLVCLRLAVVMGLTWVFGVLAPATEVTVLWYFYVLFNVLQGVFIFFSFTFTEKARKECRRIIQKKSAVFPSQTTSTSAHQSTSV